MRKATYLLFAFLGLFTTLIIGILIGRNSFSGMVIISESASIQEQSIEETVLSKSDLSSDEKVKININTASVSLLQTLPNIGQVLAQRIVDYRNENGNFTAPEDLLLVEGIGEKRLEQIREYITVGG